MTTVGNEKPYLGSNDHSELESTSLDDFHRSVLNIIAERSPCPEPKLFIAAINSGQECFGVRPLADLRELLGQCVQNLKAAGLVDVVENAFVVADIDRLSAEKENAPEDAAAPERHGHSDASTDRDQAEAHESQTQRERKAATEEPGEMNEPSAEEIVAVSSETAEDADVFDLTDELELVVEELSEGAIDQNDPPSGMPQAGADMMDENMHDNEPPRKDIGARQSDNADNAEAFDSTDEVKSGSGGYDETTIDGDRAEEGPKADSAADDSEEVDGPSMEEIIATIRQVASGVETHNK